MSEKRCSRCKEVKPLSAFGKDIHAKDGARYSCKACTNAYRRVYAKSHRTEMRESERKWRHANRERYLKASSIRIRRHYYRHFNEKKQIWYEQHKRWAADPKNKVAVQLRHRLFMSLKGGPKRVSVMKLIDCSIIELRTRLEALWKPGMNWGNYGHKGWHIDHIIPCASFDLSDIEEQKRCFHWSNLQPLWWWENFQKGKRVQAA